MNGATTITPDFLREGVLKAIKETTSSTPIEGNTGNLFIVRTANQCQNDAKLKETPKDLFNGLMHEGELCIEFADTGTGKSIYAVQKANEMAQTQKVIYADLELSDKQFESRYSEDRTNHFIFNDNLFRIEFNPDAEVPQNKTFEDFLHDSLEQVIIQTGAKILVIDNMTYLRTELEKAKDALPLMKSLKALKNKYSLSILALAHTPKRDPSRPLTRNDLQGSKMLINFCDSAFAIGESFKDKNLRYVKQIKVRESEFKYDSDNVMLYDIRKTANFLHFNFLGYSTEAEHLKPQEKSDKDILIESVKEMNRHGSTQRQISQELKISLGTVNNYLNT